MNFQNHEIHFIRDVITSIQSEQYAQEVARETHYERDGDLEESRDMTPDELCMKNEDLRLLLEGNLMFDENPGAMIKQLTFHAHGSFDFFETRKVE